MSAPASAPLLGHLLQGTAGRVVLQLNGGMMSHAAWGPITARLVDDYRVLGCDFRGQLLSPGEAPDRLEDHLPDLIALLDALDLDTVHVLGTSFGGEIGVQLAARHPDRVRSLAVVTAADRTPEGMPEDARRVKALARSTLDASNEASGDEGSPAAELYDHLIANVYSPAYRRDHAAELAARRNQVLPAAWYRGLIGILTSIGDFDLTPDLAAVDCPTVVIGAVQDAVMPARRVDALAAAISGAEQIMHPTSGHALVAEDPQWLARIYVDFLHRIDHDDRADHDGRAHHGNPALN